MKFFAVAALRLRDGDLAGVLMQLAIIQQNIYHNKQCIEDFMPNCLVRQGLYDAVATGNLPVLTSNISSPRLTRMRNSQ